MSREIVYFSFNKMQLKVEDECKMKRNVMEEKCDGREMKMNARENRKQLEMMEDRKMMKEDKSSLLNKQHNRIVLKDE